MKGDSLDRYKHLDALLKVVKPVYMAEVGCFAGWSTIKFAAWSTLVVAVDEWKGGYDSSDEISNDAALLVEAEKLFDDRIIGLPVMKLKMESTAAASRLNVCGQKFDFVYLDAGHDPDSVWRDLRWWSRLVKSGGFIGGHDYGNPTFPGVKDQVDRFFHMKQIEVYDGLNWLVKL